MGSYLRNQNFKFCYFTSLQSLFLVLHLMYTMGISSPIHYTKPAGRMIMHCLSKFVSYFVLEVFQIKAVFLFLRVHFKGFTFSYAYGLILSNLPSKLLRVNKIGCS